MASPTTGGLIMLKEMLSKLPQSEKKIAHYILKKSRKCNLLYSK